MVSLVNGDAALGAVIGASCWPGSGTRGRATFFSARPRPGCQVPVAWTGDTSATYSPGRQATVPAADAPGGHLWDPRRAASLRLFLALSSAVKSSAGVLYRRVPCGDAQPPLCTPPCWRVTAPGCSLSPVESLLVAGRPPCCGWLPVSLFCIGDLVMTVPLSVSENLGWGFLPGRTLSFERRARPLEPVNEEQSRW